MSGHRGGRSLWLERVLRLVATLLAVSFGTFLLLSLLPGDPALTILGAESATEEAVARIHAELRLDDPLPVRYIRWLGDAVTGDLGESYTLSRPAVDLISQRLPVTLELVVLSLGISLAVSIPLGLYTGYKPQSLPAKAVSLASYALLSVPSFVLGLMLVLAISLQLDLLPAAGWVPIGESFTGNLKAAALPALTLALPQIAIFSRLLRGDVMSTLDQDYVLFAESKGLSDRRVLFFHAFKPSSFTLMTLVGTSIGNLMGGTIIVETLFNLPGLGTLVRTAIDQRDIITVQAVVIFISAAFVIVNFAVDAMYAVLDPRVRRGYVR